MSCRVCLANPPPPCDIHCSFIQAILLFRLNATLTKFEPKESMFQMSTFVSCGIWLFSRIAFHCLGLELNLHKICFWIVIEVLANVRANVVCVLTCKEPKNENS